MAVRLDTPVQYLKGVGPRRARVLESAGLKTAEDVLRYLPFRYEDRTEFGRVQELQPGTEVVLKLSVLEAGKYRTSRKGIEIVEVIARDDSGIVSVKFFNQPYLAGRFRRGQNMVIFGRPREDVFTAGLVFINPQFEMLGGSTDEGLHTGRIVPI
ncbi:MAG TPA: DNA helicase RecG, partial [Acidobacteriota bacterium]|nr:DNA helicase RecG [Acidobacteriota bacterium]